MPTSRHAVAANALAYLLHTYTYIPHLLLHWASLLFLLLIDRLFFAVLLQGRRIGAAVIVDLQARHVVCI